MLKVSQLYIEQLKKSIMNALNSEVPDSVINPQTLSDQNAAWSQHFWFGDALTMSSRARLDNIQVCIEDCLAQNIPGDIAECGTWRGGAAILMRGILAAHGVTDRTVWVADSFQGLPEPPANSLDEGMYYASTVIELDRFAVDLATVQGHFERYGLLDAQVQFLPGWFSETLPAAPIEQLAVLRLDGDYYESTQDTLAHLYPKLSVGGYLIIDDWGLDQICGEKEAVLDYRQAHGITDEIIEIDYHSAYWRKSGK
ncbi:MAG: TylF/MycF/NovP-related O-methyltransferase [Chloroflexota bacterium]